MREYAFTSAPSASQKWLTRSSGSLVVARDTATRQSLQRIGTHTV